MCGPCDPRGAAQHSTAVHKQSTAGRGAAPCDPPFYPFDPCDPLTVEGGEDDEDDEGREEEDDDAHHEAELPLGQVQEVAQDLGDRGADVRPVLASAPVDGGRGAGLALVGRVAHQPAAGAQQQGHAAAPLLQVEGLGGGAGAVVVGGRAVGAAPARLQHLLGFFKRGGGAAGGGGGGDDGGDGVVVEGGGGGGFCLG